MVRASITTISDEDSQKIYNHLYKLFYCNIITGTPFGMPALFSISLLSPVSNTPETASHQSLPRILLYIEEILPNP